MPPQQPQHQQLSMTSSFFLVQAAAILQVRFAGPGYETTHGGEGGKGDKGLGHLRQPPAGRVPRSAAPAGWKASRPRWRADVGRPPAGRGPGRRAWSAGRQLLEAVEAGEGAEETRKRLEDDAERRRQEKTAKAWKRLGKDWERSNPEKTRRSLGDGPGSGSYSVPSPNPSLLLVRVEAAVE